MIDLEIGFKENFHFKTFLENKCGRRNKNFQYHRLKTSCKKPNPVDARSVFTPCFQIFSLKYYSGVYSISESFHLRDVSIL